MSRPAAFLITDAYPGTPRRSAATNPVTSRGPRSRVNAHRCPTSAGEGSYGMWLDTTTDPVYIIPCFRVNLERGRAAPLLKSAAWQLV